MAEISVIVPVYNVEQDLQHCINGILAQSYTDFELILINDGSPDRSGAICEQYAEKDARIRVIHQENQGSGPARNAGIKAAQGKYLYFCDPDDKTEPNLLKDNLQLAEQYGANLIVFGYFDEKDTGKGKAVIEKYAEEQWLEEKMMFRQAFGKLYEYHLMNTLWNKLYRRDFLIEHACWFSNQRVGQDTLFNYQVYAEMERVYIHSGIYYHYVQDRQDSSTNRFRKDRFQMRHEETVQFEQLLEHWGWKETYQHLIDNDWINTFYVGANNVIQHNSPLTARAQKNELRRMQQTPKVQAVLEEVPISTINSSFMKMVIASMKYTPIPAAYYLFQLRQWLKGEKRAGKVKERN